MKNSVAKILSSLLSCLVLAMMIMVPAPARVLAARALSTGNANLVLLPDSQTVAVNNTFTVVLQAQANGDAVVGVAAYLDFDPTKLGVNSWTRATTWNGKDVSVAEKTIDNVTGQVNYAGGLTGENETGTFTVATITFVAKAATANTSITFHFNPPAQRDTGITDAGGNAILNTATGANVTIPGLVSIAVTPTNPSIPLGLTQQFTAIGTYADATTPNLTGTANWSSSNPAVATVGLHTGLATSVAQGTTNITASYTSYGTIISNNATLTVAPPTLLSIAVTPVNPSLVMGLTQQFTATGNYTNGLTNITSNVT